MAVLLDQITLGELRISVLDSAPDAGGGFSAEIGSIAVIFGQAGIYQKTSAGDTGWTTSSVNAEDVMDILGAGLIDTATIDFTYDDGAGEITAILKALSVSNSHIANDAAIALSKLASLTVNRALVSNGSGTISVSAVTSTELGYLSGVTSNVQTQISDAQADATQALADAAAAQADINNHIADTVDAHDASAISSVPAGNLGATNVQSALNELQSDIDTRALDADLTSHLNDTIDAHDASAISSIPAGNLVASNVQDALDELQSDVDSKIPLAQKGANNGVATLDAGGKIPASQLPNTVMEYQGSWNANTNSPTLADGTGNTGDVWLVSVAGSQNLGSGSISFAAGDWIVYNGSIWEKSINSNDVVSVNGQQGVVVLDTDDVSEGATNLYYTQSRFDTAFSAKDTDDLSEGATNLYFTEARAKSAAVSDAIVNGVIDVAPSQNAVYDALALKSDVGHTHVAADVTDFTSAARTAVVDDAITNGVTTKAPSQNAVYDALALKQDLSEKGQPNGYASLDNNGKIPSAQIPALALTDVFVVADITARDALTVQEGDVAKVLDAGAGLPRTYIYDGASWIEIESGSDVDSVNGYTGNVVLTTTDISEGTNLYFTDERAQDAVGAALSDTATVNLTYDDSGNSITADVIQSGLDHGSISGLGDDDHSQYALLAGRSGGQTLKGDTASAGDLNITSTAHATKGKVIVGSAAAIDEANARLGVGTVSPVSVLDLVENNARMGFRGTSTSTSGSVNAIVSSITPASDSVELLKVFVTGIDAGNFDSASYERTVKVKNVGGTVSLSTVQSDYTAEDASLSSANCTFVVNGNAVDVRVTGVNARTINWKCIVQRVR